MALRIIIFLVINFAGLALGGLFTDVGTDGVWYAELNKAPWTPPGWVFGAAWTTIMICFAIFMAYLYSFQDKRKMVIALFALQWILNFGWNPVFFYFQEVLLGAFIIVLLTLLVGFFLIYGWKKMTYKTTLVLPYFVWLCIATSLNVYIYLNN